MRLARVGNYVRQRERVGPPLHKRCILSILVGTLYPLLTKAPYLPRLDQLNHRTDKVQARLFQASLTSW